MWNWREVRVDTTAIGDTVKSSIVARQDGEKDTGVWEEVKTAKQLARYIDDNDDGAIADAARAAYEDLLALNGGQNQLSNSLLKLIGLLVLDEERNGRPN